MSPCQLSAGGQGRRSNDPKCGVECVTVDAAVSVRDRAGQFAIVVHRQVAEVILSVTTANVLVLSVLVGTACSCAIVVSLVDS